MLVMPTKRLLLTAAVTAAAMLAIGLGLATVLTPAGGYGSTSAASADPAAAAEGGQQCDPSDPNCESIEETEPGEVPDGLDEETGVAGDGRCYFPRATRIQVSDHVEWVEVPCGGDGVFYRDGCYWHEEGPGTMHAYPGAQFNPDPPPENPPPGKSAADGRYYWRICIRGIAPDGTSLLFNAFASWEWLDFADAPTMTPGQVAQIWYAGVLLTGVEFALAPPESGAGLVGLPVWLGVEQSPTTWGPIEDRDPPFCVDGVCIRIGAQVTEVEWDMGDGVVFACDRDQHVVWRSGMDFLSPGGNCHHYYQRASRQLPDRRYQVTATSTWTVSWESTVSDAEDSFPVTRESEVGIRIDEVQVLTNR